jgi:hypothetical protein
MKKLLCAGISAALTMLFGASTMLRMTESRLFQRYGLLSSPETLMIMTIVADGGGGGIIIAMFAGMTVTVVVTGGGDTAESSEGDATASRTTTLTGGRFCG